MPADTRQLDRAFETLAWYAARQQAAELRKSLAALRRDVRSLRAPAGGEAAGWLAHYGFPGHGRRTT